MVFRPFTSYILPAYLILIIFFGCKKDDPIQVVTLDVTEISSRSAFCGGLITYDGESTILSRGIVWSTTPSATREQNAGMTSEGEGTGMFFSEMIELTEETTYYVRAYAVSGSNTKYGNEQIFSTSSSGIKVITKEISDISSSAATISGEVLLIGELPIINRGFVYDTTDCPNVGHRIITSGNGAGLYSATITNLRPASKYYIRAFASNGHSIIYGDQKSFSTSSTLPEVSTEGISNISLTSAVINCSIHPITDNESMLAGVAYGRKTFPTIDDQVAYAEINDGKFFAELNNLAPVTKYHVRAFVSENGNIVYGNQISFFTEGVKDIDGNVYSTVKIGTQVWFVENLKTTRYNNGDIINTHTLNEIFEQNIQAPKYQSAPGGDENNVEIFGRLYSWHTATDSRGICPPGFHVARHEDWEILRHYLNTNLSETESKPKALANTSHWNYCSYENSIGLDPSSNNLTGFSAVPAGGCHFFNDRFEYTGINQTFTMWLYEGIFQQLDACAYDLILYGMSQGKNGKSIRCVED